MSVVSTVEICNLLTDNEKGGHWPPFLCLYLNFVFVVAVAFAFALTGPICVHLCPSGHICFLLPFSAVFCPSLQLTDFKTLQQ